MREMEGANRLRGSRSDGGSMMEEMGGRSDSMPGACICGAGNCGQAAGSGFTGVSEPVSPSASAPSLSSCSCGFKTCAANTGDNCACGSTCPGLDGTSGGGSAAANLSNPGDSSVPVGDSGGQGGQPGSGSAYGSVPAAPFFKNHNEKLKALAKAQVAYDNRPKGDAAASDPKLKEKAQAAEAALDKAKADYSAAEQPKTLDELKETLEQAKNKVPKLKADIEEAQKTHEQRVKDYKQALHNREVAEEKVKISATNQNYEDKGKAEAAWEQASKNLNKAETKLSEKQTHLKLVEDYIKTTSGKIAAMEAQSGAK